MQRDRIRSFVEGYLNWSSNRSNKKVEPALEPTQYMEPLEARVLLSANMWTDTLNDASSAAIVAGTEIEAAEAVEQTGLVIIVDPDVTTIHDETSGLQNTPPNLDSTTNDNGNDVALDLDGTDPDVPDFPLEFSTRLTALGSDPSGAIGAALSGYDGSNDGLVALTIDGNGFTIANLALTDANGDPLDGVDSGVMTTDSGNNIFLYTDTENDNIVVGREGMGTTADPSGEIALAIYLQEIPIDFDEMDVKLWTVQYEAVFHTVPGDGTTPQGSHDEVDPVDLTGNIFATVFRNLEFDLTNAPSGQNLFIMFGDGDISDGDSEVGIVATGREPADQSAGEGITSGDTVNTSQAGGPTTFGINNQMLTASAVEGEGDGIYFTFVTGPEPDFTVPNLTQTEADVEENIQFSGYLDAKAAEFEVVQLQGGKTAVVKISAYDEDEPATNDSGVNFVDQLNNDPLVPINSVEVVDFDGGGEINIMDNGDGTFNISGVEAGDLIRYTTEGDHNRVLIENDGDGRGQDSANFDIGGFKLIQADFASADVGVTLYFEDDGPTIDVQIAAAADPLAVDETDLTQDATANFADNFSVTSDGGADGTTSTSTSYVLSIGTAGATTNLVDVATGQAVVLVDNGGGIEGRTATSNDLVFTVSVDGDGNVELDQTRALEHPDTTDHDDTVTLDADHIVLTRTDTITDGDNDTASDSESLDIGAAMSFDDDGPTIDVQIVAAADPLAVDETDLTQDATANFADNFSVTSDGGADGTTSTSTSYVLSIGTAGATTNLVDVATGQAVVLVDNDGVIEGRTATSNDLVFTVSVDGDGNVELDQIRALEHPDTTDHDDTVTLDADHIVLTRTDTITDGDGDTASDNASLDIGAAMSFDDDGPALEFGNLVGTVTTTPQVGFWEGLAGADQPGTLSIVAVDTDPTAGGTQFDMVTAAGVVTTGTIEFDDTTGTGTLTADFDNNPENGDETIGFSLTVNPDGTYVFTLDEVIVETITLSTDQGQLPAGGPDPVQTLRFGEGPDTTDFVFFAVDADTATSGGVFDPTDIVPAIELGEPDLTESELENGSFGFFDEEIEMNVSGTGIGVNNNVLQGYDPSGGASGSIDAFDPADLPELDESFVINPEPLASEIKVFISKTAGGFLPPNPDGSLQGRPNKTDYLYWNLYDEEGNFTEAILVTSDMVFDEANVAAGGTGERLWSFTLDLETLKDLGIVSSDFGHFIDALQLTMGFGNIKIPKIEVVVRGDNPPNDIFLDFSATLTDADGDTATSAFAIDLYGNDVDQMFDYTLVDAGSGDDAFNVDLAAMQTEYFVQGFDPTSEDKLVLLGDLGANFVINNSGADSVVTVTESGGEITTVVVEGVDLELSDIIKLDIV